MDDGAFSSTQQMAGDGPGSNNAAKQQRRGGGGKQAGRGGKGAAAMPVVMEADKGQEEDSWQDDEAAPTRQQQRKQALGRSRAVGTDTQVVRPSAGRELSCRLLPSCSAPWLPACCWKRSLCSRFLTPLRAARRWPIS